MKLTNKLFWGSIILVVTMNTSYADWATITPEQLQQQSDLIVVGEMIGETTLQDSENKTPVRLGVIQVSETLKGNPTEIVLLKMPAYGPGIVRSSTDVNFTKGQRGLWYLQAGEHGYYFASRPDRFLAMEQASERIETLRCGDKPEDTSNK